MQLQHVRRGIATSGGDHRGRHQKSPMTAEKWRYAVQTVSRGVTYLDLDGDGVLDAVLTVETWPDPPVAVDEPTVVETLERGIDVDGRPSEVSVLAHR
jgi:hypothetical protein